MFGKKKGTPKLNYDPERQKPILRCSICNGEQVAGLKDLQTGKFEEVMFIRSEADLEQFKKMTGVTELSKEY